MAKIIRITAIVMSTHLVQTLAFTVTLEGARVPSSFYRWTNGGSVWDWSLPKVRLVRVRTWN